MATFNTASELIEMLRDDPHLREEMRDALLTQEMRDIPTAHAALAAEVQAFVAATSARIAASEREIAEFKAEMQAFRVEVREFIDATNNRIKIAESERTEFRKALAEIRAENRRDIRAMHEITRELQRSFGDFKGNYAESAACKQAFAITGAFGRTIGRRLRPNKILTFEDLLEISEAYGDDLDIPDNDLVSFHESDLMILASEWRTGENPCYIAVEASYTCDKTDTDRAIKHAELLRKFTQMPAYAAIAGIHRHDEIMDVIHRGDVFWFELDYGRFAP